MPRITKIVAADLIQFCKRIDVVANFWDARSKSAFEFARQMNASRLKKVNPNFDCLLTYSDKDELPRLVAEYVDGTKWETLTEGYTAADLRNMFYEKAVIVEDNSEKEEEDKPMDDDSLPAYEALLEAKSKLKRK